MSRQQEPVDMGDDWQATDEQLYERYVDDPPADLVITADDRGEIGINDYLAMETRPGEQDPSLEPPQDAEDAAMHIEEEPNRPA